jgi:hypothetical protein
VERAKALSFLPRIHMTVLSPPVAFLNNLPIAAFNYEPSQFFISAIALNGASITVTTTVNHNYFLGQQVRLSIPPGFGARQLNQQTGYLTSIPALNQMVLTISSVGVDPFVANASISTQPQTIAIGDINSGPTNASGRKNQQIFINGSFINISNGSN